MDTNHQFDVSVFAPCGKNVVDFACKKQEDPQLYKRLRMCNFKDQQQHTLFPYKGVYMANTRRLSSMKTWLKIRKATSASPGGTKKKVLYGGLRPEVQPPYPFIYHFDRKGTPFVYLLLKKGTPFIYLHDMTYT